MVSRSVSHWQSLQAELAVFDNFADSHFGRRWVPARHKPREMGPAAVVRRIAPQSSSCCRDSVVAKTVPLLVEHMEVRYGRVEGNSEHMMEPAVVRDHSQNGAEQEDWFGQAAEERDQIESVQEAVGSEVVLDEMDMALVGNQTRDNRRDKAHSALAAYLRGWMARCQEDIQACSLEVHGDMRMDVLQVEPKSMVSRPLVLA